MKNNLRLTIPCHPERSEGSPNKSTQSVKKFFAAFRMTLAVICCGFFCSITFAAEDYYQFHSAQEQQRFNNLTSELRCLVCQNQNLAQSNAGLAADLRNEIYQKIQQGQSEQEIIDYLIARYGNYILYRPPFNAATLGLWIGPFILLLGGVGYLLFYLRKKSRDKNS